MNKGSIACGTEGKMKKTEENAVNNDKTEKPKTTL
jgi:hypothetical protein